MSICCRTCLSLAFLLFPIVGLAQERNAASPLLAPVAPFVDEQTVAIGRIDLRQIDPQAVIDFAASGISADEWPAEQRTEVVAKVTDLKDKLLAAGTSEVYLLFSLANAQPGEPVVIFPVGKGGDPKRVQAALTSLAEQAQGESLHGAIVLAPHGLREVKPAPRADLEQALAAAGDSTVRIAVSIGEDTRRALRESLPPLPDELGGHSGADLADGFRSITLAANLPPKPSLSLTLQARDAAAAKQFGSLAVSALDLLAKNEDLQRNLPGLKQVLPLLRPQVQASSLVVKLDNERGNIARIIDELVKPAVVSAHAARGRAQSSNNLKQMMIGLHTYHDTFASFPPQATRKDDKKLLSWRVYLLPYLGAKELYDQFHLDEPWDSDHNKKLIEKMPRVFAGQGLTDEQVKKGLTNYLAPVGPRTVFEGAAGCRLAEIVDGTSNTIAIVEAAAENAVVWTSPDDWKVDFSKPFEGLLAKADKEKPAPIGFSAALCDGSVRFISTAIGWEVMRKLLQKDDGEVIGEF